MIRLAKLLCGAAVAAFLVGSVGAQTFSNGGFETGTFSPWTTTGVTQVTGTFSGQAPNEGSFQAALTSPAGVGSGTVSQSTLESFLGLTSGTLNSINSGTNEHGGSAIAQTFTVTAGSSIQFAWDFFPNGSNGGSGQNDSVFYSLHLSGVSSNSFTLLDQTSNHPGGTASGYSLLTTGPLAAGTYILGFAVYDVASFGFDAQNPALLVDRVSVVPEPATWTLLIGGLAVVAFTLRRRFA